MSCDVARFTITKGTDNTFIFTIKADGSTLPMEILAGDTFTATLHLLDTGEESVIINKNLTVTDANSGKVSLVITEAEAEQLISKRGSEADRYYLKPVYKLVIDCSTANNGDFIARVSEVYVD